ncbi:amidohydrolase [Calocera viscosa TUFC12733]|uniref:Amidohydrolase n=1 Tax=Calocera viscosa (strain TUFC12733) TaxID=1330018 RepID=A0A167S2Q6_CALVF|nr:amidohydrolase [Calocera viscosa TUFC12733]
MATQQSRIYARGTIITINKDRHIITDAALLVRGDRIAAIGKATDLVPAHPDSVVVDCSGKVIIPGLVDTHVHTAQSLLRGCADDLSLIDWLCERVWVMQGNFTHDDGYAAARLTISEMLKSGTTTFLECMLADRYGFDGVARAVQESGIRACLGKIVMDIPTYATKGAFSMHPGLVENRETSLLGTLKMHEKWHGAADGRIHVWFGARTPGGVSLGLYKEMTQLAAEKGIRITMHCAEVEADKTYFREQHDQSPMEFCHAVGLLGPSTVLAHMVWLESKDIKMLAETGTHVAHCPNSNSKLASGFAKVPEMLESGVNVGLGCDGAPCNNTYDLIREMRAAATIHKAVRLDPTIMPAETVLEMATINGAKALGLETEIGSLEVGKKADFVIMELDKLYTTPNFNPVSTIVYCCSGADVVTVVVDGKEVVSDRKLVNWDEQEVIREGAEKAKALAERAGIDVRPKWPVI